MGISTIPIVDYFKNQLYNFREKGQIFSRNVPEDIDRYQTELSEKLAWINTQITADNRLPQYVAGAGVTIPVQVYLHQNVEKQYYVGKGENKKLCKRIPDGALVDGVHGTLKVVDKWFQGIHNSFLYNISRIEKL